MSNELIDISTLEHLSESECIDTIFMKVEQLSVTDPITGYIFDGNTSGSMKCIEAELALFQLMYRYYHNHDAEFIDFSIFTTLEDVVGYLMTKSTHWLRACLRFLVMGGIRHHELANWLENVGHDYYNNH